MTFHSSKGAANTEDNAPLPKGGGLFCFSLEQPNRMQVWADAAHSNVPSRCWPRANLVGPRFSAEGRGLLVDNTRFRKAISPPRVKRGEHPHEEDLL